MDSSLYDDDILTWSEQQVAALRELAARPGLSNALDWDNVIEEIESLGRSDLKGVQNQLTDALIHFLKGYCDTGSLSLQAWTVETSRFLMQAREDFRNSMRQRIDLDRVWQLAFKAASQELLAYKRRIPPSIPPECPFTLDEMLDEAFTFDVALRRLYDRFTVPLDIRRPTP